MFILQSRFSLSPWKLGAFLLLTAALAGCTRIQGIAALSRTRAVMAEADDFSLLLLGAILAPEQLSSGDEVTAQQAHSLRLLLMMAGSAGREWGPNITADYLLAEVAAGKETVSRAMLNARLRRFEAQAVLRADGFLVSAMTGTPLACAGTPGLSSRALRTGDYRMGVFYLFEGAGYREDAALRPLPPRLAFSPPAEGATP